MKFTIRDRRVALGLTQAQVAAAIGVSVSLFNLLENGKRRMHEDHIEAIAEALGVKPAVLIYDPDGNVVEMAEQLQRLEPEDRAYIRGPIARMYDRLPPERK